MKKLLIANRGEIARRIIRTCRERGIPTVAVYSEADGDLPFVREADEAVEIGPPPVAKSYLNQEALLKAARDTGANAVHPGYGLLSENAAFARQVEAEGLIFVGPPPQVIAKMGDKVTARQTMQDAGVPVVPGTGDVHTPEEAIRKAEEIGWPVMLKASAGGGGIGMQVLRGPEEVEKAFATAQGRAKAYFGDETLFMERFIPSPRHVEVQILADGERTLHLFERECSVQRRNQKVVEESPSPSIRPQTREGLCLAAVRAAEAVGYTGAGTVEFLVDPDENFYFLEMNTRIQVEHPVTEMVTGLDLVSLQLDIAQGKALSLDQEAIRTQGHALEFRVYAEDPDRFLPSPGTLEAFVPPSGEGIRVDAGVESGSTVTPFYDPMIAKCIVYGRNREEALERSRVALADFDVRGIQSNLPLLREVLDRPEFISGQYDTQLLANIDHAIRGDKR
ncbi:MAG: acetyl-CoA carboxylase biotin carboxylase subunit [Firmicutes bacterium]|uniref:acetyl-CoA carboxylase biotin carboxylase subunit n=1 Tax=Melghirimyces thermohalophilus TaxID=1236220 RepID=UPI000B86EE10|nr:acetyl-CoA carboxylase biotin carboxylase subunit [Melghirimyces thermohalophilus]MDA8351733.1 acetyl-CoA carboxylase biotin carboxylase subunit [Bacillota bacterium]